MDLPTAPLIFAQSFSKTSQETESPFSGDFGGLREGGGCTRYISIRIRDRKLRKWRTKGFQSIFSQERG